MNLSNGKCDRRTHTYTYLSKYTISNPNTLAVPYAEWCEPVDQNIEKVRKKNAKPRKKKTRKGKEKETKTRI